MIFLSVTFATLDVNDHTVAWKELARDIYSTVEQSSGVVSEVKDESGNVFFSELIEGLAEV